MVDEPDQPTNVQVLILGVGTVFGTLGVVLAVMLLLSVTSDPSFKDAFVWGMIYGSVGAVLAAMVCVVVALPLLILFRILFSHLRKKGFGTCRSATIAAGCLSFVGTVSVISVAVASKAMFLPVLAWPTVLVPVLLTVLLARWMFSDDREITSK